MPVTFSLDPRFEQIAAAAWLRETGEFRPALKVLKSDASLDPELRSALVAWLRKGAKRKPGYRKLSWQHLKSRLPPSMTPKHLPLTAQEKRAYVLFLWYPLDHLPPLQHEPGGKQKRGRPKTMRGMAVDYVVKRLRIARSTAEAYFDRFEIGSKAAYRR